MMATPLPIFWAVDRGFLVDFGSPPNSPFDLASIIIAAIPSRADGGLRLEKNAPSIATPQDRLFLASIPPYTPPIPSTKPKTLE